MRFYLVLSNEIPRELNGVEHIVIKYFSDSARLLVGSNLIIEHEQMVDVTDQYKEEILQTLGGE